MMPLAAIAALRRWGLLAAPGLAAVADLLEARHEPLDEPAADLVHKVVVAREVVLVGTAGAATGRRGRRLLLPWHFWVVNDAAHRGPEFLGSGTCVNVASRVDDYEGVAAFALLYVE